MAWLTLCVAAGVIGGLVLGGWGAIRSARNQDFAIASRQAIRGTLVAWLTTSVAATVALGWAWYAAIVPVVLVGAFAALFHMLTLRLAWRWLA